MSRRGAIWGLYGLCVAVLFGAMAWVSVTVVGLDRERAEARERAAVEETVRIALWRMDSALAMLVAGLSATPPEAWSAMQDLPAAFSPGLDPHPVEGLLLPSPLLGGAGPEVRLHFEIAPSGALSSPQVPEHGADRLVGLGLVGREQVETARARLAELKRRLDPARLRAALASGEWRTLRAAAASPRRPQPPLRPPPRQGAKRSGRGSLEYLARANMNMNAVQQQLAVNPAQSLLGDRGKAGDPSRRPPLPERIQPLQTLWLGGLLLLARRVAYDDGTTRLQGVWLDWPRVREDLLHSVADLLPEARLLPVRAPEITGSDGSRRLAALPVRLEPGRLPPAAGDTPSTIRSSLLLAWAGVLLAALAVGALLRGVIALSDRRARFVSAVTHELRTPLTTFRMYSEMLEAGMVRDEGSRKAYLRTLSTEADRLSHLVENVLSYARIERGADRPRLERVLLVDLLDGMRGRLSERAAQVALALRFEHEGEVEAQEILADPAGVERILFNLVDNACKYAAEGDPPEIVISAHPAGRRVALRVRDFGPGLPADVTGRLFRPFSKSAKEAAHSAPGVGLGLALCRRLARKMGADLRLEATNGRGACFVLELPLSPRS